MIFIFDSIYNDMINIIEFKPKNSFYLLNAGFSIHDFRIAGLHANLLNRNLIKVCKSREEVIQYINDRWGECKNAEVYTSM